MDIMKTENLRIYIMSENEQANFDPDNFVANLKAAGFRFDSESCPFKLTQPWDKIAGAGGSVIWRQWD